MPRHGHNVNAVKEDLFVDIVDELLTLLSTIKLNLLKAGVFPGCDKDCCIFQIGRASCRERV